MKKQITIARFTLIIGFALFFIAAGTQQDKNQNKKDPKQKESKHQPKHEKGNEGGKGNRNDNTKYNGKDKEKGNGINGKDDTDNGNNDKEGMGKKDMKEGYKWDRETFKERNKYRNRDKVTICHKFNREGELPVTISVSSNAMKAHLDHGDVQGDCPTLKDDRYSKNFLVKRTDYYNTVQDNSEQVSYSNSILEYALERLGSSRQQLALMKSRNMPLTDIERKQLVVVELEQNVSLLQSLIGVAANLVTEKLQ